MLWIKQEYTQKFVGPELASEKHMKKTLNPPESSSELHGLFEENPD